jgi:hypothetical protein
MNFFKKKRDKEVQKEIFDYFKIEKTDKGTLALGDFADKDFCNWLAMIHGLIQIVLKTKPLKGTTVENYVNMTFYFGGQRVEVAIIKDGGKSPIELLKEIKSQSKDAANA